ncbi:cytochrome b N-terminal domain-containing protein [Haliangium ochraceum]|uniref:Cytochrome b/b6 domain protein n=1 Tax=Haliangium ochraceum (strain DSM 14365 / JCM 11303 / SMP-2) TaxID=502025 RepID=D0LZD0_HALO1|nr:cytochrome b N-terminal domain-containing protein [Haliangium ochraceum]ACY16392.1 Cytochrome b/b6 domain protein [Haliangium ochraceum DSM 14365]
MKRVLDWLDDRTGYRQVVQHSLDEPVAGGASFAYVFGSVLTFILLLQMVTGVFLAMYYSPSATDAWASVAFIQDSVTMGWFIRGLHSYGASAMVIVSGLHLLQTGLYGAYKKPREMNWIVGVLMLGLILAFALTGYLLPWDQTGYWATKVATGIAGTSPLIGAELQQVAQGGNEYGNLTLTRFFAIHVFILPAALIGLVVVHIALFRRHGVTPKWGRSPAELERDTEPFWPDQMFKDIVAMAVAFSVLVGVNIYSHGVKLDGPADPASNFDARPEWYFRALFQLLKYFEGTLEHIVALGLPVVVGGVLLGLPFVDRGPDRSPRARIPYLTVLLIGALAAGALTYISFSEDAADEKLQERMLAAEEDAALARRLARENGVPAAGGTAVYTTAPHYRARTLWDEHCGPCHEGTELDGPRIAAGYNSREWIRGLLQNPDGDHYFGMLEWDEDLRMPPVELPAAEMDAVVEFVYAETGATDADKALAEKGQTLFDEGDCSDCHERDGVTESSAPNLGGRGTVDMLAAFIANAGQPHFFGEMNEMPEFSRPKLSEDDRYALAEYLVWLQAQPMIDEHEAP